MVGKTFLFRGESGEARKGKNIAEGRGTALLSLSALQRNGVAAGSCRSLGLAPVAWQLPWPHSDTPHSWRGLNMGPKHFSHLHPMSAFPFFPWER